MGSYRSSALDVFAVHVWLHLSYFFLIVTSFSCCLFPSLVWRYVFGRSLSSVFSLFYQIFACPLSRGSRRALGAACSSAAALAASSYRETNSPTLLFFLPAGASAQRDLS